ncbi:MAG: hypothetical protein A2744_01385 [Candidatus Buchananbacteria bacterium RIFCSPHIGHO2_01_FULL_44_11]|uniref:NAD-dependent epimerase/dehydratase domain-containing protein n=1 Tax=Candidatus Buchananbacteria bacterium RIFCSPHIGHO2_01_FULL_44_11 TaxID=1797535 RepID=A0A1G1Y062_9BACT|nr:MAG: hypothetical protein A2744_01385 [Candidatus Buchananbacteria bacterium RIFCSPHIGHO2_01_FULL_44_11]
MIKAVAKIKRKNILIIGAAGFVGQALVKKLLSQPGNLFLTAQSKKFKCSGAKVFYGDLTDKKFCQKIVRGVDLVYYLAGYKKNIAWHAKKPFEFFVGNLKPFLNFLAAAQRSKIKKIVYLSSTIVDYAATEQKTIDGYAWGKYANELALKSFKAQNKIDTVLIRSAAIYGPGDNFNPAVANFIPATIGRVSQAQGELVIWGRGLRKMQFIFIDDLVANLVAAQKTKKDFFVVGNPEVMTVNQVVQKIIGLSDKKLAIKHDLSKPDKSSQLVKFSNLVKPQFSLSQGLAKTISYYQQKNG